VSCAKTGGPILTIYTSYDVSAQGDAFWRSQGDCFPCGDQILKNLHFGGVNRHFKAKLFKYQHLLMSPKLLHQCQPNLAH